MSGASTSAAASCQVGPVDPLGCGQLGERAVPASNSSASHISVAQLLSLAGTKMSDVVYRGTAPR